MITRTPSYECSDGNVFVKLETAQGHELSLLFKDLAAPTPTTIADVLVKNAEKVIDVLTTTATSKSKARAINGGKKSRKPKQPEEAKPATP